MRKTVISLFCALIALPVLSQGFEPRETWPFIYEEFLSGEVRSLDGSFVQEGRYNITVSDGSLLYVDNGGTIMRPDMTRIYKAAVGEDVYVNVLGKMYKVLSESENGAVLQCTEINVEKRNAVNIGYGISSSTASAQNLVNVQGFDTIGKKLVLTEQDKYRGEVLPVKQTVYFRIGTLLIPANRQEVLNVPGVDRKQAGAFFKQEKIKWKDVASLEKVLAFIYEQLEQK